MRSIPATMVWETLQRGKWTFLGAFLTANSLPALITGLLSYEGALQEVDRVTLMIHVNLVLINGMVFGAALLSAAGHPLRLSTYPVSASFIALCQLIPAMVLMALEYVLAAMVFNAAFHVNWPLWGPAAFLAVGLALVAAIGWTAHKSPWYLFVFLALSMVLVGIWFHSRYGLIPGTGPLRMWPEVTPWEALTMLATAAGAYRLAVFGIARTRCGEFLGTPRLFHWLGKLLDPAPAFGAPFSTAARAQFWFEWRQKGWAIPAEVLFVVPMGLLLWLLFNRDPRALYDGMLAGGACLPIGAALVGLFLGNVGPSDGKIVMGHFLATRPMTSLEMSRIMLKTGALSALIGWLLWGIAFLTIAGLLIISGKLPETAQLRDLWYLPGILLCTWLGVSLPATVVQTGRGALLMTLFCGIPSTLIAWSLFGKFTFEGYPQSLMQFHQVSMVVAGLAAIAGTGWLYLRARRRRLIHSATLYSAAGLWLLLSAIALNIGWWTGQWPIPVSIGLTGGLALAALPLAGAPLALTWNRNR
ncbi:MAG: hypothetical protein ACKV0T_07060 [Planctomycetales bacterium]